MNADVSIRGDSRAVMVTWDNGPHHLELEVGEDGKAEWFYARRDQDATRGYGDDFGSPESNEQFFRRVLEIRDAVGHY